VERSQENIKAVEEEVVIFEKTKVQDINSNDKNSIPFFVSWIG
jgi:hypothetical protein